MIRDIAIIALGIAALATIGSMDAADEAAQERHYCEMVALWQQDAAKGLPPEERGGWPNYRRIDCR